jgi:small-conductance mechanosensitive channel
MKSTIHNETYPYPEVRATVNVGVGYNSDIRKVREVMLDEAHKHPKVLKEPPPDFVFLDFGDSSLDVSIRCRVSTIEDRFFVSSDLREQVLNRFRVEGIKIPFPQRVVTMVKETGEKGEA